MNRKPFLVAQAELLAAYRPRFNLRRRRWLRALLPTPGNALFTLLVVGGLLWATSAGALPFRAPALASDSTTTISYQGRLADSNSDPVNSPGIGMRFCLYDTDVGGSPVDGWCEDHLSVPVEDGLFHVLLGSTNPIPVSLLANNSTLWLGVTVGSDSEMTPREQIASVPYAMIASTVADGSITTAKLADGAINGDKVLPGTLSLTHTNFLAGAVSIQGPLKTCESHGGEPHCYREATVTHNYGNPEYFVVTGTHHGHGAHMFTVSIHGQTANTFVVRATSIVNNYWDEEHEVIVHWLLLPSQ